MNPDPQDRYSLFSLLIFNNKCGFVADALRISVTASTPSPGARNQPTSEMLLSRDIYLYCKSIMFPTSRPTEKGNFVCSCFRYLIFFLCIFCFSRSHSFPSPRCDTDKDALAQAKTHNMSSRYRRSRSYYFAKYISRLSSQINNVIGNVKLK